MRAGFLDVISEGLDMLKNIALDLNEVGSYLYNFSSVITLGATRD